MKRVNGIEIFFLCFQWQKSHLYSKINQNSKSFFFCCFFSTFHFLFNFSFSNLGIQHRQQIENDLRQQLRFQLEDGTKKPYDYMIGVFKVTLGKAKGLSEVHGIRTADLFNNLDADESGALSKQELTRYLKVRKIDLNSEQIDDIINTFKVKKMVNEDGDIMCEGFISCLQGRLS